MSEAHLIKKYSNRRLYDSTESRYVNLDDLRKLIIAGASIKVVEQATGQEITTTVLLQIIEEAEKHGAHLLQPDFLAQLIRLSDKDADASLQDRLNSALCGATEALAA